MVFEQLRASARLVEEIAKGSETEMTATEMI